MNKSTATEDDLLNVKWKRNRDGTYTMRILHGQRHPEYLPGMILELDFPDRSILARVISFDRGSRELVFSDLGKAN